MKAKFMFGATEGEYPCCKSKATRFQCTLKAGGCTALRHKIKAGSPRKTVATRAKNFELLQEHFSEACEPFVFNHIDVFTGHVSRKVKCEDGIDEEKSLLHMVQMFIK